MKNKKKFNQVAIFFERCWLFAFQHSSAFLWCCFFYYAYNINFIVIAERNETRANILFHSNSLSVNLLEEICSENPNCNRSIAQCNSENTMVDLFFNTLLFKNMGVTAEFSGSSDHYYIISFSGLHLLWNYCFRFMFWLSCLQFSKKYYSDKNSAHLI